MKIFDGKAFAKKRELLLKKKVDDLKKKGITPKLVSFLIGNDPASELYVSLKKKAAERIGAELEILKFPAIKSVNQLSQLINKLNEDKNVHGIMVQLPLPKSIKYHVSSIINSIAPEKDVDGLRDDSPFVPATVKAVLSILVEAKAFRKKVVVVGASGMVGKPLGKILNKQGYEVIKCDIQTKNLIFKTKKADILISATGVPKLIRGDMVKDGAIVIDVGSPKGDVDPTASLKASFFTPVPGGVGPVTIISLLENLVYAAGVNS